MRQIIHVDMDAFFASIEQLDDPELRGKPVLVGGASRRGVVAAASYEARPFGVRSAMPMMEALRRCPDAIVVPPRGDRYSEVSGAIFDVFRRFTPLVQGLSVDEAFLDVTGSRALFGDGGVIARQIKQTIVDETGLTASAGVSPSKFVSKIASDLDKPDGLVVVRPGEVAEFLRPLSIDRMWGVGPTAASRLRGAGFETVGDLAASSEERLAGLLGSWGRQVFELANGRDEREVVVGEPAKSIGAEQTFETDLSSRRDIERQLLAQARRVARRLSSSGTFGDVVTVKLKYADFTLKTRQKRLPEPVADTDSIYAAARELLGRFERTGKGVRLTGVAVGGLTESPAFGLFPDERRLRNQKIQDAVSDLERRFGKAGLTRATLLGDDDAGGSGPGGG